MARSVLGFSLSELVCFFAFYAIMGWVLECVYCSIKDHKPANRGFLYGPWCPIYGFGAVALIVLLTPLRRNIVLFIPLSILVATGIEFVTGWIFERVLHMKLWDYTGRFLNIKGYVCLSFSILWGVLAALFIRYLHPWVEGLLSKVPPDVTDHIAILVLAVLGVDALSAAAKSVKLSGRLGHLHELRQDINRLRARLQESAGEGREALKAHLSDLTERYDRQFDSLLTRYRRRLRAFPGATSHHFPDLLGDIRAAVHKRRPSKETEKDSK